KKAAADPPHLLGVFASSRDQNEKDRLRRAFSSSIAGYPPPGDDEGREAKKKGRLAAAFPVFLQRSPRPQPSSSCSSFLAISSMFSGGHPGMSMPRRRPIELRTSLISFRLLRPKFGVRSISASVFWTRSPM